MTSTTPGSYVNTIPSGALINDQGASNNLPATDTLTVSLPTSTPNLFDPPFGLKTFNDASVFKHEAKPWLTLLTCKEYDERMSTYRKRVVVRAVLVDVEWK